jgi:alcohol dehydrogenase
MRALVLDSSGTLSLQRRPTPSRDDECLIRVTAAGICGTDLELLRGYAGFTGIPGHEFAGIVERAGVHGSEWVGRRVVGEITVGCGHCAGCRAAGRGHCDSRTVLGIIGRDGAFAEYLSLPPENLHALPDTIDDLTAVFIEPVAAACRVVEQVPIGTETRAAVVGAGRLGLLIAQVLREHGAHVTAVARSDRTLKFAESLGFQTAEAGTATLSRAFDVVVDASGAPAGFTAAAKMVRPRGTFVLKSTFHGETPVSLSPVVVDEIAIVGSRCGPFAQAIEMLGSGRIVVQPLVAGIYPLQRFADAFEHARRALKVIFDPVANGRS